jgi:hypothetical protein
VYKDSGHVLGVVIGEINLIGVPIVAGSAYPSPDTCVGQQVYHNQAVCFLQPSSPSGSEILTFNLQFNLTGPHNLIGAAFVFDIKQIDTKQINLTQIDLTQALKITKAYDLTQPFLITIPITSSTTTTVSITNLQVPSNVLLGKNASVTLTATYGGAIGGDLFFAGIADKSVPSQSFTGVNGTAYSSSGTCATSFAGTAISGKAMCLLQPSSPFGSETVTFSLPLPSAKTYSLIAVAGLIRLTATPPLSINSTLPFSIVVSPSVATTLTTTVASGQGTVGPNCPTGCSENSGSSISVQATASTGWQFSSWSITGASCSGGPTSNPCTFTMPNNAVTISSTFTQVSQVTQVSQISQVTQVTQIPGFPVESILAGIALGILSLACISRRRKSSFLRDDNVVRAVEKDQIEQAREN